MYNYANLTEKELLKLVIKERDGENIVEELLSKYETLPEVLIGATAEELSSIKGLGKSRILQLKAIDELAKRLYYVDFNKNKVRISSPRDIADLLMVDMRYLKQEVFKVIFLDTKNNVIGIEEVFKGTLNSSIVHPREVFASALKKHCANIIVSHNHPSGDVSPSKEDINITIRLKEAGDILEIKLLDHVIIGDGRYKSLKESGVI